MGQRRGTAVAQRNTARLQSAARAPQSGFAVKIVLDQKHQQRFPIGAQGAAAIYTGKGPFDPLRRIVIRTYSWLNWLYPLNV